MNSRKKFFFGGVFAYLLSIFIFPIYDAIIGNVISNTDYSNAKSAQQYDEIPAKYWLPGSVWLLHTQLYESPFQEP